MVIRSFQVAAQCLAALVLVGCTAGSDIESRDFLIQQNSSLPPVQSLASQNIQKLVGQTSAAYVTLVVSDSEKAKDSGAGNSRDRRGTPATSGSGFVVEKEGYVVTAAHVALEKGNAVKSMPVGSARMVMKSLRSVYILAPLYSGPSLRFPPA